VGEPSARFFKKGGQPAGLWRTCSRQHGLNSLAAGLAQQGPELSGQAAPDRIRTKEKPGYARHDQQQRPHRKHGVIRQRGAEAGAAMAEPLINGGLQNFPGQSWSPRIGQGVKVGST